MNIFPSGLHADSIRPVDLKMTDRSSVTLTDIKEPIENVVVIFGVEYNIACAIEDGSRFAVDQATCSKEAGVCRFYPTRVAAIDETFLE